MPPELLAASIIFVLSLISPGPDFALVSRNALLSSRKIGTLTACGIALGTLFHIGYCLAGLSYIIKNSLLLSYILQYFGAGFLIYLGVKGILAKPVTHPKNDETGFNIISGKNALWQGILCNVLNPKATFFFIAIFSMVMKPEISLFIQRLFGFEVFIGTLIWFLIVALFFSKKEIKNAINRYQVLFSRILGVILIYFGFNIAFMSL